MENLMHIKMAMMVSLLSLGLLSQNTYAQTPSDESIAQWARITDFKNDFEQGVVIGYINSAKTRILLSIKKLILMPRLNKLPLPIS